MNKLPVMSGKDFVSLLIKYGCVLISVRGSHHKLENPVNGNRTIVPVHGGKDLNKGFMLDILRNQLGIDVDDFLDFIR